MWWTGKYICTLVYHNLATKKLLHIVYYLSKTDLKAIPDLATKINRHFQIFQERSFNYGTIVVRILQNEVYIIIHVPEPYFH